MRVFVYDTGCGNIYFVSMHLFVACAIHFEVGNVHHYTYTTEVSLNEANEENYEGAHRPVGFRLSGDLRLSVVWKKTYDYLIKLDVGNPGY